MHTIAEEDLRLLLLIRHFELALLDLFTQGKLNGTTHTSLGQEYIPVALRSLIAPDDFVFSNHRGHGHYLSRFQDPAGLLAEIMGRAGAICHGVGGSQHIYRAGTYLSTGVQGESLPVGLGVAMHFKRAGKQQIVFVYVGDGTWGEGSMYEALNIAQLWMLPVVIIVENNQIAQSTPITKQMAGSIQERAQAFHCRYSEISSCDLTAIRAQLGPLLQETREAQIPIVLEFHTVRVGPHSKGDDTRSQQELDDILARDWYRLYQQWFPQLLQRLETEVKADLTQLIAEVAARPFTTWEEK